MLRSAVSGSSSSNDWDRFRQVGQSKAKLYLEKGIKVMFADVAGVDKAKEELREVIGFLKTPEKSHATHEH